MNELLENYFLPASGHETSDKLQIHVHDFRASKILPATRTAAQGPTG